jgi:Ca-activated chloride channel family protein
MRSAIPRVTVLALVLASLGLAQTLVVTRPILMERPAIVITAVDIDIRVEGPMARVLHRLTLENRGPRPGEFDLLFPLGSDAVVSALDLRVDGRTLEGKVYDKERAAAIYRNLTRSLRDPALLEHYGQGLVRARVAPVPPGGKQEVTIAYDVMVKSEGGLRRLALPLTAFRRVAGPFALTVEGTITGAHPVTTFYSPTHEVRVGKPDRLSGDSVRFVTPFRVHVPRCTPDLDFVCHFKSRADGSLIDIAVLSSRPDPTQPGYFLAVINGRQDDSIIPEPKDVVFVIDRSGSMQGKKIEQAKGALKFLIQRMGPKDRFNIVTYAAEVDAFSAELTAPGSDRISAALMHIEAIQARGGTNIQAALDAALAQLTSKDRTSQIVFLTDGLPTVGERDERKICEHVRKANLNGARVVAFGVGHDVNGVFLDRVAAQNSGLSEYVLPNEDIEEKVPGFYARMQSPLLLDTLVSMTGTKITEVFPKETGDLYGGQQMILTGRYAEPGRVRLSISGRLGQVQTEIVYKFDLAAGPSLGTSHLVPRMWAARKIGYLVDEIRLNGQAKELVNDIVRLGTEFGILTEYTSFLAAPETDLTASATNSDRAGRELRDRVQEESGSHGVAQAANAKKLQRDGQVATEQTWLGTDGRAVSVGGVQNLNGRAFFKRGDTWLDATLPAEAPTEAEEIPYFSDAFFDFLDRHPALNQQVARTGDVTVNLDGKAIRFVQRGS